MLLDGLDATALPRVNLYRASARVSRWDYEGSIPLLVDYARARGLSAYERIVARVNLAAALVYGRKYARAEYLLRDLLHDTSARRLDLALGRVMELTAELFLARKRWDEGERFLVEAERRLADCGTIDLFFVRKFRAVAALGRDGTSDALRIIREQALVLRHWETLRDCERIEAMGLGDRRLMARVWFGTPYESFRERIRQAVRFEPPAEYLWSPGSVSTGGPVLDLTTGRVSGAGGAVKVGQVVHRLLCVLCSDFYRPFRTATLWGLLFAGEHFNPHASPLRVRQAILRLRRWFGESGLPLGVEEDSGGYRLTSSAPCAIRISAHGAKIMEDARLKLLRETLGEGPFSIRDAGRALDLAPRTMLRLLRGALGDGKLERVGSGNRSRYVFARKAA